MQGTISGRAYTDDARRMADTMNLHAVAGSRGWAIFALADGRSPDMTPYEDIGDAHRAMRWDRDNYLYLEIPRGGVNDPAEMQAVLNYARALHKAGYRLPDPYASSTRLMRVSLFTSRPLCAATGHARSAI